MGYYVLSVKKILIDDFAKHKLILSNIFERGFPGVSALCRSRALKSTLKYCANHLEKLHIIDLYLNPGKTFFQIHVLCYT